MHIIFSECTSCQGHGLAPATAGTEQPDFHIKLVRNVHDLVDLLLLLHTDTYRGLRSTAKDDKSSRLNWHPWHLQSIVEESRAHSQFRRIVHVH